MPGLNPGVSVSGLKSWVRNPMLRGIVPHQKDGVKPLISPEEWETAKRLLDRRSPVTGAGRRPTDSSFFVLNLLRLLRAFAASSRDGLSPRAVEVFFAPCDWFGRSIAEELARQQALEALRQAAPRMAQEAQRANNAKASEKTSVQVEVENKLAAAKSAAGVRGPRTGNINRDPPRSDRCLVRPGDWP